MEIDYINGSKNDKVFGMSKYQMEIHKRIDIELNIIEYDSIMTKLEKLYNKTESEESNNLPSENRININSQPDSKIKNLLIRSGRTIFQNMDRYRYNLIVRKILKKTILNT